MSNASDIGQGLAGAALLGAGALAGMAAASSNPSASFSGPSGPSGPFSEPNTGASRTGAYDAHLPCKNPSCNSFGIPHPNCRCYPGLAKGGEVQYYCAEDRQHKPHCEYFAEGGITDEPTPQQLEMLERNNPRMSSSPTSSELEILDRNNPRDPYINAAMEIGSHKIVDRDQILAGMEGAAHAIAGPVATTAEIGLGKLTGSDTFSKENIARRKVEHPIAHLGAEAATTMAAIAVAPWSAPALMQKAAAKMTGSKIIQSGLTMGMLKANDAISNGLLGLSDKEEPYLNAAMQIGAAGILGLGAGIGVQSVGKIAEKISKPGTRMMDFITGFGAASKGEKIQDGNKAMKAGAKYFNDYMNPMEAAQKGANIGLNRGKDILDTLKKVAWGGVAGYVTSKALNVATPAFLKIAKSDAVKFTAEMADELYRLSKQITKGEMNLTKSLDALFQSTIPPIQSAIILDKRNKREQIQREQLERKNKEVDKFLKEGGPNKILDDIQYEQHEPQNFAEGGDVVSPAENNFLDSNFPEISFPMNAAKMRISTYLNSLRPLDSDPLKLAYDDVFTSAQKEKDYHQAINIANDPLSILTNIKNGTLQQSDLVHFTSLYPDLKDHLDKKITERITKSQLEDVKPNYQIRQGLGTFLGVPLSSEFKPTSILAAQKVFVANKIAQQQQQAPKTSKQNTSALSKGPTQFLTGLQSRNKREQKQ